MSKVVKVENFWQVYPENKALSKKISEALKISPVLAQLLLNRNIRSLKEARAFLEDHQEEERQEGFPDDLLRKGTALIQKHVDKKSLIFIVGDYDVDGMTSTTLFIKVLEEMGADYYFHIPHRFKEGYGLNKALMEKVASMKTGLLITLDCGITQSEEIAHLKQLSDTEVMILDHHQIPDPVPEAELIIHPKQLPETNPCWHLCTAGIAYQFLAFLIEEKALAIQKESLLDLAALGTIADIVPLVGENRRMTKLGLRYVAKRQNLGLKHLLAVSKHEKPYVSARDVSFVIAPRLNAAGRLTHAKTGVELLMAKQAKTAERVSKELEDLNRKRREIGDKIYKQAVSMIEADKALMDSPVIVLSHPSWHAGVIGIIASRIINAYGRPTILIAEGEDMGRGSARSVPKVNIHELIERCSEHLHRFGGHHQAAGFSVHLEKMADFKAAIIEEAKERLSDSDLGKCVSLEMSLSPKMISLELITEIERLSPFGMGNESPVFYTTELKAIDFKAVGDGSHLKARFSNQEGSVILDAIGFGLAHKMSVLYKDSVQLAFSLDINDWAGVQTPQLQLVDLK